MSYEFLDYARDAGIYGVRLKGARQRALRNLALHELWETWRVHRNLLFRPLHRKQLLFLSASQPITAFLGPNRQGKTYCGAHKVATYIDGQYPDYWPENKRYRLPTKGLIFVSSLDKHYKTAVLSRLREWLPHPQNDFRNEYWEIFWERGLPISFLYLPTGSSFVVVTHEVRRKTLEGGDYHWVWCDEPPPFDKYLTLQRGIMDRRLLVSGGESFGEIFITATPVFEEYFDAEFIQKSNLAYDSSDRDPNIFVVQIRGQCNPYISAAAWDMFEKSLSSSRVSEGERRARLHGDVFTISGLVYPQFRRWPERYFIGSFPIPPIWTRYMMWDPHEGLESEDWVLWVAVAPNGQQFVYDEAKVRLPTPSLLDLVAGKEKAPLHGGVPPYLRVIDAWAFDRKRTGWAGYQRSLVEEIRLHRPEFCFVKAPKYTGSIEAGRNMVEGLLEVRQVQAVDKSTGALLDEMVEEPLLRVFGDCVEFRRAAFGHSEQRGREKRGVYKCCFDCLRWLQLIGPRWLGDSEVPRTESVPGNDGDETRW